MDRLLTADEIRNLDPGMFPMMVFSDSMRSFFSWGIKAREKGYYSHFMWYHRPGFVASQDWLFGESSIEGYLLGNHRMKFVHNPGWSKTDKVLVRTKIRLDLSKPWYKRCYDPVQVLGKLVGCDFVQMPGMFICSDRGEYLRLVDREYDLEHPSPTDVNLWTKARQDRYSVWGRFLPD